MLPSKMSSTTSRLTLPNGRQWLPDLQRPNGRFCYLCLLYQLWISILSTSASALIVLSRHPTSLFSPRMHSSLASRVSSKIGLTPMATTTLPTSLTLARPTLVSSPPTRCSSSSTSLIITRTLTGPTFYILLDSLLTIPGSSISSPRLLYLSMICLFGIASLTLPPSYCSRSIPKSSCI